MMGLHYTLLPPPKKELMFLVQAVYVSVCLSVRRIIEKSQMEFH